MRLVFSAIFCLLSVVLFSQDYILSGIVKDSRSGEPLIGATVNACSHLAATDIEGRFYFEIPDKSCQLEVRYLGYDSFEETVELPLEDGEEFIVFLSPSANILNQAVITANKFQQKQAESTVSLEVIKPALLSASNSPAADDVLDLVPGVEVIDGQANIRGGSGYSYGTGSRVLLVIDDMPALQFDGGISQWNDIPVENIEQIEVLKGASSVLYGSAALNGVIHFKTADAPMKPRTKAGVSYRHFLAPEEVKRQWWDSAPYETNAYLTHARKFKKFDFTSGLYFNRLSSYNQSISEKRGRAYVKVKYKINSRMQLALNADLNVGDNSTFFYWGNALRKSFIPSDGTISLSKITRYKIDPVLTYYDNKQDRHTVKARFYNVNNQNSGGQAVISNFQYLNYTYRKSLSGKNAKLLFGIEGLSNQTDAELYANSKYFGYNGALFIQWNQKLWDKFSYVLGVRYEVNALQNPDFEYTTGNQDFEVDAMNSIEGRPVFRAGLNYEPVKGTYLRSSIGQGYRFPTIAEKFTATAAGNLNVVPNPFLESETGWSAELGLRQELAFDFLKMFVDVAGFYSQYNNMMEFTLSDQITAFQARNIGNTQISGVESALGMQWDLGALKIRLGGSYTYVNPTYRDFTDQIRLSSSSDENILKYRYRHSLKSNLGIDIWKLSLWVNQRYISHMVAIDSNFETFLPGIKDFRTVFNKGYNLYGAQIAYNFRHWKLGLNLDNAFNVIYTERPGLLEAPRNVSIRLEFDISKAN